MQETTANEFRQSLQNKVDACISNHDVLIRVKRRNGENFVVLGESDCPTATLCHPEHHPRVSDSSSAKLYNRNDKHLKE